MDGPVKESPWPHIPSRQREGVPMKSSRSIESSPPKTDSSEVNCYNVFFLNQMLSIGRNCRDGSGGVEIILNNFENPEVKLRSSNRILLFIAYSQWLLGSVTG